MDSVALHDHHTCINTKETCGHITIKNEGRLRPPVLGIQSDRNPILNLLFVDEADN